MGSAPIVSQVMTPAGTEAVPLVDTSGHTLYIDGCCTPNFALFVEYDPGRGATASSGSGCAVAIWGELAEGGSAAPLGILWLKPTDYAGIIGAIVSSLGYARYYFTISTQGAPARVTVQPMPDGGATGLAIDERCRTVLTGQGGWVAPTNLPLAANFPRPIEHRLLGAVYNATAPAATDKDVIGLQCDAAGNLKVTLAASTDRTATGTIALANDAAQIGTQSSGTTGVQVSGVWTGTLVFEASVTSTNPVWQAVNAIVPNTGALVASTTANGTWVVPTAGYALLRVRATQMTSGTASVALDSSVATQTVEIGDALPVGDNLVGRVKVTDGANVQAVKAASATPVAADPAAVVSLSVNSASQVYNTAAPTPANGAGLPLQSDSAGNLKETLATQIAGEDLAATGTYTGVLATAQPKLANGAYSPTLLVDDFAANVTKNVKASPGVVTSCVLTNRNVSLRYFQVHNTTSAPAGGAVPVLSLPVPADSYSMKFGEETFSAAGFKCATGVSYAWSTTEGTYTAATAADHSTIMLGA